MDIVDELTDLCGAPQHEVKAVADKAIKEIERLQEQVFDLRTEVHFDDQTIESLEEINRRLYKALKEILKHEGDYDPIEVFDIARAALEGIE